MHHRIPARRSSSGRPACEDYPDRPPGDLYCRVPQDSPFNVRGARNHPCLTRPGKRAPTVGMCESDEQYVPLNDGYNWKGDPNATLSGQDIPQLPPGHRLRTHCRRRVRHRTDRGCRVRPRTGRYIGPDGKVYTQSNLGRDATDQTWQDMLMPPGG